MTDEDLNKRIVAEYEKTYKDWKHPVAVTQKVPKTFGGTLAVVNAIDGEGDDVSEMCFVFDNGNVQIFQSTEQLAIFLDSRARIPSYQKFFGASTLSGVVFLLSIILMFVSGFFREFPDKVSTVLSAVVGAAAGFYFKASK